MTHYPSHSKIYHIKSDSLDTSKINKDPISVAIKPPITYHTMPVNSDSLRGLVEQYDSDSDQETVNGEESLKLDAKVDNFLQEINQIAPEQKNICQKQIAWQECFDESTGYPYYWNMETNIVTWDMPLEYEQWLTEKKTINNTNINNKPTNMPEINIKKQQQPITSKTKSNRKSKKKQTKKTLKNLGSSDDEKIVMITSFSEDSLSGSETEVVPPNENEIKDDEKNIETQNKIIVMGPFIEDIPKAVEYPETKKEIIENIKDENIDETVILARLRTQAKVLHELGGELPKSVDKTILSDKIENKPQSLCLVAGYGDDSEHSDVEEDSAFKKTMFPIPEVTETIGTNKQTKESTLFPATVPIDVKQFETNDNTKQTVEKKDLNDEEHIDNKAFKRKKRLGLTFDVKKKRIEETDDLLSGENRKGFGFQTSDNNCSNLKKGGIVFIKADILNSNESKSSCNNNEMKNPEDFTEIKNIVTEKVQFLGEGKDPVSAVQIMSIQLQTLEAAFNVQALTKSYLCSWLRETFTGLEKLEQEAAPDGWTCQWDRSHKRYFYRNTTSGETQWHYPEVEVTDPDIVGGGEAMDICTTPPPNEDIQQPELEVSTRKGTVTPSPPRKQNSPSPPPPPSITLTSNNEVRPPIPTAPPPDDVIPPPPPPTISENQPLPPGVDSSDLPYFAAKLKEMTSKSNETGRNSLGSELDSFYSDIAQLEASGQESVPENVEIKSGSSPSITEIPVTDVIIKKKKKSKKMGQGINMKKKAVSSLVEKWKKVQNDY